MLLTEIQFRNVVKLLLTEDATRSNAMAIVMSLKVISRNDRIMHALQSGNAQYVIDELHHMIDPICQSYNSNTEDVIFDLIKTLGG